ncbi:MAG: hypothetical protein ACUVQX_03210 [Candidatus Bathycorpusculaceae bacterium]
MNRKILTLNLICLSMLLFIALAQAQGPSEVITVWTDKPQYSAGQTGKLYITYNNVRDSPVTIRNISIVFEEWWAYDKTKNAWIGNLTYEPPEGEKTLTEHTIRVFEVSFTVPTDGRATKTKVDIKVYTNLPTPDRPSEKPTINVFETPVYMEQIITLFTIQVVLLIVCTVIIAATIFLSARRPQVMWKAEEKGE